MKICVLGNSHAISLFKAWNSLIYTNPDHNMTFFVKPQQSLADLVATDGCLVPDNAELLEAIKLSSGGFDRVNLADFDICLIHGLQLFVPILGDEFSVAVRQLTAQEAVTNSLGFETALKVRSQSDIPIYLGHCPLNCKGRTYPGQNPNPVPYRTMVSQMIDSIRLSKTWLLPQPPETIVDGVCSRADLARDRAEPDNGIVDLSLIYGVRDNKHMNEEFGILWLTAFFEHIAAIRVLPET